MNCVRHAGLFIETFTALIGSSERGTVIGGLSHCLHTLFKFKFQKNKKVERKSRIQMLAALSAMVETTTPEVILGLWSVLLSRGEANEKKTAPGSPRES